MADADGTADMKPSDAAITMIGKTGLNNAGTLKVWLRRTMADFPFNQQPDRGRTRNRSNVRRFRHTGSGASRFTSSITA
jgi:hypothetical protein